MKPIDLKKLNFFWFLKVFRFKQFQINKIVFLNSLCNNRKH